MPDASTHETPERLPTPHAKRHAMNTVKRFILTYSPFIVLAAAAVIGVLHVTYYW